MIAYSSGLCGCSFISERREGDMSESYVLCFVYISGINNRMLLFLAADQLPHLLVDRLMIEKPRAVIADLPNKIISIIFAASKIEDPQQ